MKIRVAIQPGELPARADDLRRCVEHVIEQHAPGCGRDELCKATDPDDQIDQRPKKLDYLALETSVNRARRNVTRAQRVMLRKINAVLAEVK